MAPKGKAGAANGSSGTVAKKKEKTMVALDGLITDLYQRVAVPLDPMQTNVDHLDSLRAIHRILLQIQKQERHLNASPPQLDGAARMRVLTQWLQDQGLSLEGFQLDANLPQGAGVVAAREYEEGSMIASIPTDLMMTTATAALSKEDVGLLCEKDAWSRAVPSLILAMHLLFEKHRPADQPSRWQGYIQSLPGQVCLHESNLEGPDQILLPLAFSMETIEAMQGSSALGEYHRMLRNVAKQYTHVRTVLRQQRASAPAFERAVSWFTFAEFRWAVSTVMMRQNQIPALAQPAPGAAAQPQAQVSGGGGARTTMALVPLMDMFNHEEGELSSHFDVQSQAMEVTAKRKFQPGEQIMMSYGTRPSIMMLLYNGFLPAANWRDRVRLPVELPASDPLFSKKLALLRWLELPPTVQLDLYWDGSPSPELAMWLKVAALSDEELIVQAIRNAISAKTQETAALLKTKGSLAGDVPADAGADVPDADAPTGDGDAGSAPPHADAPAANGDAHVATSERPESSDAPPSAAAGAAAPNASMVQELQAAMKNMRESKQAPADGRVVGVELGAPEAAVLSMLCEKRLRDFGPLQRPSHGQASSNGTSKPVPQGLGLGAGVNGLGGEATAKNAATKTEMELVTSIRTMEENALRRAIARSSPQAEKVNGSG